MYQAKTNEKFQYNIELIKDDILINDQPINWDLKALSDGTYSIISNNKSYVAVLENIDVENKTISLRVNQNVYTTQIQEPIDQLLAKMGLNMSATKKVEPIKAPMPGLILKILVEPGQQLKKGDAVLILEAMKMENVFKASTDAVVKAIKTDVGKAVEKGEILVELE